MIAASRLAPGDDPLLTTAEVAALLGVTVTTVKRWSDQGLLRCAKTAGKHRRFSRFEVERFRRRTGGLGNGTASP